MERNATILVSTTGKLTTKALLNVVSIFYNTALLEWLYFDSRILVATILILILHKSIYFQIVSLFKSDFWNTFVEIG